MPDQKLANKDLRCIKKVFDKLKLPLFLYYGTALGAYRDNDFLPEEKFDIDLGTFGSQHRKKVWVELERRGFVGRWKSTIPREHYGYLPIKRNVSIDLFFFDLTMDPGGEDYRSFARSPTVCAKLPKQFSKLEKIKFLREEYLVPSPIEDYLAYCYGDWKDKSSRKHGFPPS